MRERRTCKGTQRFSICTKLLSRAFICTLLGLWLCSPSVTDGCLLCASILCVCLGCRKQGNGIGGWNVGFDMMIRATNISTSLTKIIDAPPHLRNNLVRRLEWECLGIHPSEEGNVPSILLFQPGTRHGQSVQLNCLPHVHADLNQIRQYGGNIAARMKPDRKPKALANCKEFFITRLEHLPPEPRIHHEPAL